MAAAIIQFAGGSTKYFGTYHAEVSTKPKKIQPENRTVSMDKCCLSSAPVHGSVCIQEHLTGIQKTQVQILTGSQCLFFTNKII